MTRHNQPRVRSHTALQLACLTFTVGSSLSTALEAQAPAEGYPESYAAIIEGSRAEDGLTVFSNVGEVNWRPVIEAFEAKYPWVDVQTLDLGASEVFERFFADQASGANTADIILSSSALSWLDAADQGYIADYDSPETASLPEWSMPLEGVYTISADPMVIAYNKLTLPEADWPTSMSDLATLASERGGRTGTYGPNTSGFSQALFHAYVDNVGDLALENFATLGPVTDLYRSAGPVLEKITTGEYEFGYFMSGISLFPLLQDPARAELLGWSFDGDGAVIVARNFAITESSQSPNSARLFADFLLSQEGQQAVGVGGLVPYRSDVSPDAFVSKLNYDRVVQQVGADKVVLVGPDPSILDGLDEFSAEMARLFNE